MKLTIDRSRLLHIMDLSNAASGLLRNVKEREADLRLERSNAKAQISRLLEGGVRRAVDEPMLTKLENIIDAVGFELPTVSAESHQAELRMQPATRLNRACADYAESQGLKL